MNSDEQGRAGRKLEVFSEHTFLMTSSLFAGTKICILIFSLNLQFSDQLNGFISFSPMESIFLNSLTNS